MIKEIEIEYVDSVENIKEQIKQLLIKYDEEFVPPLSSRLSSRQTEGLLDNRRRQKGVMDYYSALMEQEFILAMGKKLIGFLSFYHSYESEYLRDFSPSNYVTTIIVEKRYRGKGIATRMYNVLFHSIPDNLRLPYVTTRTWSTNYPHHRLLEKLGFQKVAILRDHRGIGIHTIYWGIKVKNILG